ncbi:MAG: sigma-70 family RNA polymerase sigma factor [Coriobacteriales bacterium]|nr:sigma-70 family RNA polymerase sigma factor [Coriobacteriales bacterium]
MREQTDVQLVELAQSGDVQAYGQLFDRYESRIYNFAYSILGNAEDARDVTQDAFIRVFEALPRKEHLDFSPYVYRTARNLSFDVAKARGRYIGDPETTLDAEEADRLDQDPERANLFLEQTGRVREALAALSAQYRTVLTLREVDEMSYQQIADVLGMSTSAVGVTLSRARLKFRGAFRMQYVDAEKLAAECRDMLPRLSAYIDDELAETDRAQIEAHLDECPLCRLAADEMRESSKSYRAIVPLVPPGEIEAAAMEAAGRAARGESVGDVGADAGARPLRSLLTSPRTWAIVGAIAGVVLLVFGLAAVGGLGGGEPEATTRWPTPLPGSFEATVSSESTAAPLDPAAAARRDIPPEAAQRSTTLGGSTSGSGDASATSAEEPPPDPDYPGWNDPPSSEPTKTPYPY